MPLIAAHFDTSGISFLIKKDKKSTEMLNFPYVYSKGILSNQASQKDFHKYLIEKILTERGIKISTCDILTCGFMDPPDIDLKTKFSVGVVDLIESSEEFVPVFINSDAFITNGSISAFSKCRGEENSSERDFGEYDQLANFCVYPHTIPDDISSQISVDSRVFSRLPDNLKFESGRKIVFTGGRFSQNILNKELNYILMLEVTKGLGVFDVYLDTSNAFFLNKIVQMYNRELAPNVENFLENSGLVIRTGGATECLLSNGVGDDQFIEIEENRIFIMPLNVENPAKLSLKSHTLGTIDVRTNGGKIGLIFDTRTGEESIYSDVKLFNDCLKQFEEILGDK